MARKLKDAIGTIPPGAKLLTGPPAASLRLGGLLAWLVLLGSPGCTTDTPDTSVVVYNHYPSVSSRPVTVYRAYWHSVEFSDPIPPGGGSQVTPTVPASGNWAYALVAPGWVPAMGGQPGELVALRSRSPLELHQDNTLPIFVDDSTFIGNCAAGSTLSQEEADFITQRIFPEAFAKDRYEAATCSRHPLEAAGTGGAGGAPSPSGSGGNSG